jgi:hypothetical protein
MPSFYRMELQEVKRLKSLLKNAEAMLRIKRRFRRSWAKY